MRQRFRLTGDICIETNPADVDEDTVRQPHDAGVALVSLGVQSFFPRHLRLLGRRYEPPAAERALALLAESGFVSVNADIIFALPGQTPGDVTADLHRAAQLGADQITTYPLFTFPYSSVGEYLRLSAVRMPDLRLRWAHYHAIDGWCTDHDFQRVSVWGFKRGAVPRYSSVTRDGYIGVGPGAGSHLPDGFVLNTFDLDSWVHATSEGRSGTATVTVTETVTAVAAMVVTPNQATVALGDSLPLVAAPQDARGTTLGGRAVTWSSSAPQIASVSDAGILVALREGTATITAPPGWTAGAVFETLH